MGRCTTRWVPELDVADPEAPAGSAEIAGRPSAREPVDRALPWVLVIVGLVAQRFWDYWSTLLS